MIILFLLYCSTVQLLLGCAHLSIAPIPFKHTSCIYIAIKRSLKVRFSVSTQSWTLGKLHPVYVHLKREQKMYTSRIYWLSNKYSLHHNETCPITFIYPICSYDLIRDKCNDLEMLLKRFTVLLVTQSPKISGVKSGKSQEFSCSLRK